MRLIVAATGLIFWTGLSICVNAQTTQQSSQVWRVSEVTDAGIPTEIVPDRREIAPNGLPDGRVTVANGNIAAAWYSEPTKRYAHGVLGDAVEAGALKVRNKSGKTFTFRLSSTQVFEDIAPRLADLDGDGKTEVIAILSSKDQGGSIAIFQLNGNAFLKVAQSPFIGRPNRWLNIAEIDTFFGGARPVIAAVITPHLRGLLHFYQFKNNQLKLIARGQGFSNHFIGSNELRLSAVGDVNKNDIPDLAIPSLSRNELVILGMNQNKMVELARARLPARINRAIAYKPKADGTPRFFVGLDDQKIYSVTPEN